MSENRRVSSFRGGGKVYFQAAFSEKLNHYMTKAWCIFKNCRTLKG